MSTAFAFLNYAALQARFGGSGLLRFDQTIEDVTRHRMKGIIGILSQENFPAARAVSLRLNTEMSAAMYPADFEVFFPAGASMAQKNAWVSTVHDRCAEFIVVPFDFWMCDQVIFAAVSDALNVNKRVSVLVDGKPG